MTGYGRENEMEADRLGLKYMVKAGYNPESIGKVFNVFQAGEKFERQRAAAEGREPRLYHGVFSSHPSPDERAVQAAKGAANIKDAPPNGWIERHDEYLTTINGIAYGSSKAQGIVRDNRFYHADMGITVAFPRGWTIENQRDRLIAFTPKKDAMMQIMIDAKPEKQAPREFLLSKLKGQSVFKGEPLTTADGRGIHRSWRAPDRPSTTALGPVRWVVDVSRPERIHFCRCKPLGARWSAGSRWPHQIDGADIARPQAFGVPARRAVSHQSGEGHRRRRKLSDYAPDMPEEKFKKETLELINAMYPNKEPKSGQLVQDRRVAIRDAAHRRAVVALIPFADRVRLFASLELANHGR